MALKFVISFVLMAVANAGYLASVPSHVITKVGSPAYQAVATTHQNVARSFAGTVSQYSKSVHTPYSSVHKEDTRVTNNVYTSPIAKTLSYATRAVAKPISYSPASVYTALPTPVEANDLHAHQQPTQTVYAPYISNKLYTQDKAAPTAATVAFSHQHEAPFAATTTFNHEPAATTYSHNSPALSAYGSRQTVHYSPAETVSHMNFDGFGTHWGF